MPLAKGLQALGRSVEVVTGFPNYPGGKIYSGYRIRLIQREELSGVRIVRLPLYPSHNSSGVQRAANYISFAISALIYLLFFARRVGVIYAYHPPLTVGIAAAIASKVRKIPVVLDVQDMWPDTLRATGMVNSTRLLDLIGRLALWVYGSCSRIAVLSPGFRRLLIERGVPSEKIEVVYNWAPEVSGDGSPIAAPDPLGKRGFTVLFAGNMGRAQGLGNLMQSAGILRNEAIDLVMLGGGVEVDSLKQIVSSQGLENVRFLPPVSFDEVGGYLSAADCLLVHLREDPLFDITIPSKTQAYMAAGKPVILVGRGDAATLIENSGCGFTAPPERPDELVEAIRKMAALSPDARQAMGRAGREYYERNLSLEKGVGRLNDIFGDLVAE